MADRGPGLHVGGAEYPAGPPEQWPAPGAWAGPSPWGSFGPAPEPEPEQKGGRAWSAVVAGVAVVLVLALTIVGIGVLATDDDGGEETASATTEADEGDAPDPPATSEPVMPTMPTVPFFDPGTGADPTERARPLEEVLPELIAFVEEARGHQFETEPEVEAVPAAEFEQRLATSQEADPIDPVADVAAPVALGLLPPDIDLAQVTEDLGAVGVLGFYEPETQLLLVKGDVITPFVQSVIVHELTHALDDQIFDLSRLEGFDEQPDETAFGFLALVEGTASEVQGRFEEQMSPEDQEALEAEQLQLGFEQLPQGISLPPYLLVSTQVPYSTGERFIEALVAEGGMAAVDAAYDDPPTTSEQILDAAVYLAGEGAVALDPPEAPAGVEVVDQGAFGAADLRLLEVVSNPMAIVDPDVGMLDPVEGFGGGRYVAWEEGGRRCISLEIVGDDAAGSATIAEAIDAWSGFVPDATVSSRVGGTGVDVVTALSCV